MPPGRRDPPALLICIRGRWQSVPPESGFAIAKRGRLQGLSSGTIRGALRHLQLCLPSKARLGPRLSFKKLPPSDRENSENDVTLTETKQITLPNRDVRPCKRTRETTSSEEEEPIQSVTVATIHAAKQRKTSKNHQSCIRRLSSESKSSEKSRADLKKQISKEILIKSPKKLSETSRTDLRNQKSKEIMESPKKLSVSTRNMLDSPKKSLSLRRKPVGQTNSSKQSSPILKSKDLSEKQISRYLQSRSGKQNENSKMEDAILSDSDFETDQSEILKSRMKQRDSTKKINSLSELNTKNKKLSSKNHNKFHKYGPKRQKIDQNTDQEAESPKTAEIILLRPNKQCQTRKYSKTLTPETGTRQELEIDERDIELIRIFIQNHFSDRELLKFDADDEYKQIIFFRINPLVNIERCPIIDRMLRRSQDSQITLTDFASNLGLRSISETASVKTQRYKIRKRTEKSYVDSDPDSSSEDKENNDKMPRRTERILKKRENNMRESNTGENKALESKNKVSNKRVLTRKRAESDSKESNAQENNKKAEIAIERTTRANQNTVESESEGRNAKKYIKKAEIAKKRTTRTNHNTVESDSENNNKEKKRAKTENSNTVQSHSDASTAKENNKKSEIAKERSTKTNHNAIESDSEVSNAKEKKKKISNTKKQTKTEVRNKENRDTEASDAIKHKEIDNTVETVELSSGSETIQSKAIKKTAKTKPVISSKRQRSNLEYSSLEDHAIVAWVSSGSRASRVNGNLLWRQLQDQYKQITGSRRTWHSLRNRYLRYILPKLGDLALPLSQQTRLRAAAATGEIKGRKAPRRNSIFTLPPRGAASRKLVAADKDKETEKKELSNRSPRYSSLTRQFTRRHNLTRPSSELSDNSQRSNKLEVQDGKKPGAKGNPPKKPHRAINSPHQQTTGKATRNALSDSDKRSESPRRDKDSSDSSSESEDESKETNKPRITRRSVNDANKRMSRNDTEQNTNESKRRLKRQSNIIDGLDESKSLRSRSRGVVDRQSAGEKTNESPRRNLVRQKSSSEQTSRDSSDSMSQSRRESPVNNRRKSSVNNLRRSRRDTKNRDESEDESNESRRKSPIRRSPKRKLNRNKSPSKTSSKGSNTSGSQVRHKLKSSIKSKNTRHDSSSEENNSSSDENDSSRESVSQPRRKSNRINSPQDRSNRCKSNRLISPIKQNGRLSSDSPRRKSNRLTPNESSNKRRHSSESKRKSKLAKRDSLDVIAASDSSESFETKNIKKDLKKKNDQPKKRADKQNMRRLFNPKAIL